MPEGPSNADQRIESLDEPARQAMASFRGYAYQVRQTVRAWLQCADNEQIYCEFAEDIDKIRRDANGQVTDVELNQIKHQAGPITLRSHQTVQTINNFFRHKAKNPTLSISMRLWTISERTTESGCLWLYADNGLDLWEKLQRREVETSLALGILRSFLRNNGNLSPDVLAFVETATDNSLLEDFVDRIHWDTGAQGYTEIDEEIGRLLQEREPAAGDADECRRLIDALLRQVTDLIATDRDRVLTKANLDRFLGDYRSRVVRPTEFRALAGEVSGLNSRLGDIERMVAANECVLEHSTDQDRATVRILEWRDYITQEPPPLPQLCSNRTTAVEQLRHECESNRVVWVYGWNGAGKSTLIKLLVRQSGEAVVWCRLRGVSDFEMITALRVAIDLLKDTDVPKPLLVLDDLELSNQATLAIELVQIAAGLLRERNGRLLIASQTQAPSRLLSTLYGSVSSWSAPGMNQDEISDLLVQGGLEDEQVKNMWAIFIYLRTGGHPQLVSAYVVHAKTVQWSLEPSEVFQAPSTAEQVKAEGQRILSRVGGPACELARRLSVIGGQFSKQFAIDLGTAGECLPDPGYALDCLIGPWVQPVDNNRFVLSPLLEGYALAGFGSDGLNRYFQIAAEAWLRQRSITSEQALQMTTIALLSSNEFLLLRLSRSLLSIPADKFALAANQLSLLAHLDFGQAESHFSVISKFFFRHLQMRIAEQNADWELYAELDNKVLAIVEPLKDGPLNVFRLSHYAFTNLTLKSPLPFIARIERAIATRNFHESLMGEESSALETFPFGTVVATAASTVSTREDLESLTGQLADLDAATLKEVAKSFEENPDLAVLLIERVWVEESKRVDPHWAACLDAFQALMKFAAKYNCKTLQAGCVRGSMIVLDEFQNDSDAALSIADQSRESGLKSPLIDLAEVSVRLQRGDRDQAMQLLKDVESSADSRAFVLERAIMLGRALRFLRSPGEISVETKDDTKQVVSWGENLATELADQLLGMLIRIAFTAERGLLHHIDGDYANAAETFERAISELEAVPEQDFSVLRAIRFRIGQCCGILGVGRWKGPGGTISPVAAIGSVADFTDPPDEILNFPAASYPELWGLIAVYAGCVRQFKVARRCANRAEESDRAHVHYVAANGARQAIYLCDLLEENTGAMFASGLEWSRGLAIGMAIGLAADDRVRATIDIEAEYDKHRDRVLEIWQEALTWSLLEPFFMTLCSLEGRNVDIHACRIVLQSVFGPSSPSLNRLDLIESALAAVRAEDLRAVEYAHTIADEISPGREDDRRIMMLACCASTAHSPNVLMSYQVAMLKGIIALPQSVWALVFFQMVAKRWIYVAENQKFQLSRPHRSAPHLLEAANEALRVLDVRSCAKLLLVAAEAAAVHVPSNIANELMELAEA